jgi:hypothetical protein
MYSGGARGAEAEFGALAEKYGLQEVNYSFEGHQMDRTRGARVLTTEELGLKDVSMTYVSKLMNRSYSRAPIFRKVLQSICWQGTGWGAEYAKICNKPLFVFDQKKDSWFTWRQDHWEKVDTPVITHHHFTGTGTRFLEENGKQAIRDLFERSFG